jgi:radical SAM protein with 4Fe4S-binding SPASM domain
VKKGIWRENKNMSFELFKKIIDEGAREGLYAINLNNYGEPTINPHLVDMVKYAKSKGILDVFFHTNGVLLTKELSKKLIEAGFDRIMISVDSPYKEKYEKQRVGAKYEAVMQNIKDLFEERKKLGSDSPLIRVNMIKFPDLTEKELDDMKKLFLGLADVIGFLELDDNLLDKKQNPDFPKGYKSKFICPQIISRLTVLEYGAVCPCCVDIDATLKLGDANKDSLKELWNSKQLANLRKLHFSGRFYDNPTCRACDWALKEDMKLRG